MCWSVFWSGMMRISLIVPASSSGVIWMERDLEAQKAVLHEIDSRLCDDESRLFGVLFSALTSTQFRRK